MIVLVIFLAVLLLAVLCFEAWRYHRYKVMKSIMESALMGYIDMERKYEAGEAGNAELEESYEMMILSKNEEIVALMSQRDVFQERIDGYEAEIHRYKNILEWNHIPDYLPPEGIQI